jgi:phosphatidylglycerophosphate synthase
MRKIEKKFENPFDNILIDIGEILAPYFKKLNFTANDITTLSLIFGLLAVHSLCNHQPKLFVLYYSLSYLFDCADGFYARKYKMTSAFGCYYDHIKDISIYLIIVYLVYKHNSNKPNIRNIVIINIIFALFMIYHVHLQELLYDTNESPFLKMNFNLNYTKTQIKEKLKISRYFGLGSFTVLFLLSIVYLEQ